LRPIVACTSFAPSAEESSEAAKAIQRLGSSTAPASVDEARERAADFSTRESLLMHNKPTQMHSPKFPATTTPQNQLRRGASAFNARRNPEAIAV